MERVRSRWMMALEWRYSIPSMICRRYSRAAQNRIRENSVRGDGYHFGLGMGININFMIYPQNMEVQPPQHWLSPRDLIEKAVTGSCQNKETQHSIRDIVSYLTFTFSQHTSEFLEVFLQFTLDTELKDEVDMVVVLKEGVQLEDRWVAEPGVDGHLLPHPTDQSARCDLALVDLVLRMRLLSWGRAMVLFFSFLERRMTKGWRKTGMLFL